jgi:hypothetical protein
MSQVGQITTDSGVVVWMSFRVVNVPLAVEERDCLEAVACSQLIEGIDSLYKGDGADVQSSTIHERPLTTRWMQWDGNYKGSWP